MNTINCRIKVNEYQDIPGVGITPAEAIILREIHQPALASQSKALDPENKEHAPQIKACWNFITNAKPSGVASKEIDNPKFDSKNEKSKEPEFIKRERTNREEVGRLREKYNVRAKSGAQGSHILDDLFPGQNPELPKSFEEIGLIVEAPEK